MEHNKEYAVFENKLLTSLQECTDKARTTSGKFHCDPIWTAYHFLRTSDVYVCDWECVLELVRYLLSVTSILGTKF